MARKLETTESNKIETILLQEGQSWQTATGWRGTITGSNQGNRFTAFSNDALPYVYYKPKGFLTSTRDVQLYCSGNGDKTGTYTGNLLDFYIPAGGVVPVEFGQIAYPLEWGIGLAADSTQNGVSVVLGSYMSGTRIINDLNFNAPRKVYWLGDSITGFTSNDIGNANYYQFQVRDWLSTNSSIGDYRLCQKAIGGKTSVNFNNLLIYGSLYVEKPDFIFYQLGVNDQSQSVSTTTYKSNLERIVSYKNAFWKDSVLVFLGATPVQQNARQTALDAYRTAMNEVVTAAANPKIKFINLFDAFDRTATPSTIWAASDVPATNTDCLHPGTLISHTGIANKIINAIQGWGLTL